MLYAHNDKALMVDVIDIRDPYMTAAQFKAAQRELGLTDRELADNLGLSPRNGHVTVRRMKNDEIPVSGPVTAALMAFLEGFRPPWYRGGENDAA